MGSDSDLATMRAAAEVLQDFGVPCQVTVVSAHRTPQRMMDFAQGAHLNGVKVSVLVWSYISGVRLTKIHPCLGGWGPGGEGYGVLNKMLCGAVP